MLDQSAWIPAPKDAPGLNWMQTAVLTDPFARRGDARPGAEEEIDSPLDAAVVEDRQVIGWSAVLVVR
jgi:hypothetical protein